MAPWWPCTLPGTSYSFSSLLRLPGAFPGRCHLPPRSCSLLSSPNGQNLAGVELSETGRFIGVPGWPQDLSRGQALPEKLRKPGLALEDQYQTLQKGRLSWGWKGFRGFRPHPEGCARFPPFPVPAEGACARRCPALIPSLSLPLMNKPLEATGEEWSDISGGHVGLLIYFSRENILKQKAWLFSRWCVYLMGKFSFQKCG